MSRPRSDDWLRRTLAVFAVALLVLVVGVGYLVVRFYFRRRPALATDPTLRRLRRAYREGRLDLDEYRERRARLFVAWRRGEPFDGLADLDGDEENDRNGQHEENERKEKPEGNERNDTGVRGRAERGDSDG